MHRRVILAGLCAAGLGFSAPAFGTPAYQLAKSTPLGAPDRWDYAVFDPTTERVYVAHMDRLAILDARSGELVGEVTGIEGGTHGTAISAATGQGFTDDGRNGLAIAFDLRTLKITRRIPAGLDADAMTIERSTGHVFVVDGDPGTVTVIDPKTDTVVATVAAHEKMEYAASDDEGAVYVAGVEKRDLLRLDARSNAITAKWPTPDCASPHGLAIDRANRRLFMGCENRLMMVVDADSGRLVEELPIGQGNDAVAYDPVRRRVFATNGRDGTISVFQQTSADAYQPLDLVTTMASGRTLAVDPETGRLFVPAAELEPNATPGGWPRARPGSLRVMMFDPIGGP